MVKVLMLITSLAGGGAERVVSELSLNLAPNVQRRIVTLTNEISYPSNVPPLSLNFNLRDAGFINIVYAVIVGIIRYRQIVTRYNPHVSMSFLVLDNFINVVSNINKNTKVIVSVHAALSMKFHKSLADRFAKFLIKILYNEADLVIAVSRGVRDELIRDFNIDPEKIRVIYNPVDIEKIRHLAREKVDDEWFNELPILMNMGRLKEQKGQWHLIRAFSKVRQKTKCKLVIRGNGELKPYLEKLVRDLGLTGHVKFLEWQDNPFKYISKASIFVFPSLWEALPYALIEAMTCGCPVIATDCKYGTSEILGKNSQYGILVPCMDGEFKKASDPLTPEEECLANEISKLLEAKKLRKIYSEKAKKRAKTFDKRRAVKAYQNTIEKIANP